MAGVVEASKRRLLITLVLFVAGAIFVLYGALLAMPTTVLEGIYEFFGGTVEEPGAWEKQPPFLYAMRTMVVMHVWIAATFFLIMTDPLKYRSLYWINMLALLAMALVCVVAGVVASVPALVWIIDGLLCLVGVAALWIARAKPNV